MPATNPVERRKDYPLMQVYPSDIIPSDLRVMSARIASSASIGAADETSVFTVPSN